METDYGYFRRRASEEREAAMKAEHSAARRAHLELAHRCEDLATEIEANEQRLLMGGPILTSANGVA